MAVNEKLTDHVRELLIDVDNVAEKKMFSGIAFMVNDKLCIAVGGNRIMCRIDPAIQNKLLTKPGCTATIMKGGRLNGYINVDESVLYTKKQTDYWVGLALDYNPKAKSSKKSS